MTILMRLFVRTPWPAFVIAIAAGRGSWPSVVVALALLFRPELAAILRRTVEVEVHGVRIRFAPGADVGPMPSP